METRAERLENPSHPTLGMLPLGLLPTAVVFDVIYLTTGRLLWAHAAFWMVVAGIACAAVVTLFGANEWLAIPKGTRAKRIAFVQAVLNLVTIAVFATSLILRLRDPELGVTTRSFGVGLIGFVAAILNIWLGGELLEDLGTHNPLHVSRLAARENTRSR